MNEEPQISPETDEPETEGLGETVQGLKDNLVENFHEIEETYLTTRDQAYELNRKAVDFIQANPGTCIVGAFAVGYLVGKIAKRRWWI